MSAPLLPNTEFLSVDQIETVAVTLERTAREVSGPVAEALEAQVASLRQQATNLDLHLRSEAIVADISKRLLDAPLTNIEDSLRDALAKLGQSISVQRAYIFLLTDDGKEITGGYEWLQEGIDGHDFGQYRGVSMDAFPWSLARFKRHETIVITRPEELPAEAAPEREGCESLKVAAYVHIPLTLDNHLLGWLGFDTVGNSRRWSPAELKLLEVAKNIITSAIQRKRREELIFRQRELSQRVTSIGVLAAGLAHEINNPLAVLIGNLSYIDELLAPNAIADRQLSSALSQAFQDAREGAQQVRQIVADLRALSHGENTEVTEVDLKSLLDATLRMASNQLRHRAKIIRSYNDAPPVKANASQLGQVILNLVVNAAQAIPEGRANENEIELTAVEDTDDMVKIEIRDSGRGIPRDALARVFDPFYSTREVGGGMGMGLAVCHKIVTSYGGTINVGSVVGIGTKVTVRLPRSGVAKPKPEPKRIRILLVDDEPIIRAMITRFLREYDIVEAANGREALDHIEKSSTPFDLILCDVTMPDLGGDRVYQTIQASHPGLEERIVFITGGALSKEIDQFLKNVPNTLIQKPFEPRQLRDLVAAKLSSR